MSTTISYDRYDYYDKLNDYYTNYSDFKNLIYEKTGVYLSSSNTEILNLLSFSNIMNYQFNIFCYKNKWENKKYLFLFVNLNDQSITLTPDIFNFFSNSNNDLCVSFLSSEFANLNINIYKLEVIPETITVQTPGGEYTYIEDRWGKITNLGNVNNNSYGTILITYAYNNHELIWTFTTKYIPKREEGLYSGNISYLTSIYDYDDIIFEKTGYHLAVNPKKDSSYYFESYINDAISKESSAIFVYCPDDSSLTLIFFSDSELNFNSLYKIGLNSVTFRTDSNNLIAKNNTTHPICFVKFKRSNNLWYTLYSKNIILCDQEETICTAQSNPTIFSTNNSELEGYLAPNGMYYKYHYTYKLTWHDNDLNEDLWYDLDCFSDFKIAIEKSSNNNTGSGGYYETSIDNFDSFHNLNSFKITRTDNIYPGYEKHIDPQINSEIEDYEAGKRSYYTCNCKIPNNNYSYLYADSIKFGKECNIETNIMIIIYSDIKNYLIQNNLIYLIKDISKATKIKNGYKNHKNRISSPTTSIYSSLSIIFFEKTGYYLDDKLSGYSVINDMTNLNYLFTKYYKAGVDIFYVKESNNAKHILVAFYAEYDSSSSSYLPSSHLSPVQTGDLVITEDTNGIITLDNINSTKTIAWYEYNTFYSSGYRITVWGSLNGNSRKGSITKYYPVNIQRSFVNSKEEDLFSNIILDELNYVIPVYQLSDKIRNLKIEKETDYGLSILQNTISDYVTSGGVDPEVDPDPEHKNVSLVTYDLTDYNELYISYNCIGSGAPYGTYSVNLKVGSSTINLCSENSTWDQNIYNSIRKVDISSMTGNISISVDLDADGVVSPDLFWAQASINVFNIWVK